MLVRLLESTIDRSEPGL